MTLANKIASLTILAALNLLSERGKSSLTKGRVHKYYMKARAMVKVLAQQMFEMEV